MLPPLSPLEAYDEVMAFAAARGEDALRLAMHAAVPQVLRPELLHLLRLNFVSEAGDDPALEADVLFAPFCAHLGGGYYRFDGFARRHLLKQLDPVYRDERVARSRRVGSFLMSYFDEQCRLVSGSNDAVHAAYVEVERWVALAFFDPGAAAQQLAAAVRDASEAVDVAARLRLGGLSGALSTPLAQHHSLLAYAAGVEAMERGDLARAQDLFEPLGDREMSVGSVALRSPKDVLDERLRPAVQPASNVDVSEERTPDAVEDQAKEPVEGSHTEEPTRDAIFIAYAHQDEKWREELETFLKPLLIRRNIALWSDRSIVVGENWDSVIHDAIARAHVAVLLVSANFLASSYVMGVEFAELERRARLDGLALVWIPVSACLWEHTPINRYQAAIDPTKPLNTLSRAQRSRAFTAIARWIESALERQSVPAATLPLDPEIFFCYRRGGDDGRVFRLADRLKDYYGADRIFQDIPSIPAGVDFLDMIQRRVEASAIMIVVIDSQWLNARDDQGRRRLDNEHDIVRLELVAALERKTRVLPVLLGEAWMPSEDELPPDIAALSRWNAIKLTDDYWDEGIERLKSIIDESVRGDEPQSPIAPDLTLEPKRLFIVIQRDTIGANQRLERVFNFDGEMAATKERSVTVYRIEIELTDPRGQTTRMPWTLFYEYAQAGMMQRSSNAHPIQLRRASRRSFGVQFRDADSSRDRDWPSGHYQLRCHAWLSAAGPDSQPELSEAYAFTIDGRIAGEIRRWVHASEEMWRRLNDPHNAVGIPLTLRRANEPIPRATPP